MTGREDKNANNLFFLCSLIEYISRKTKNHRNVVANAIGKINLQKLFNLSDVYHSENIDKLTFELIEKYKIENGYFDNISSAKYSIPSYWDIGKVYKRLIIEVSKRNDKPLIDTLLEIYNSWLSRKIENFNSSIYYESPEYLLQSYTIGENL
jgi:hypothetical protein